MAAKKPNPFKSGKAPKEGSKAEEAMDRKELATGGGVKKIPALKNGGKISSKRG